MATWEDLGKDNRVAACQLKDSGRWRSCVSRAYYAIYSAVTHELIQQGIVMPKRRGNPGHQALPQIVGAHLLRLRHPVRWQLSETVERLYKLRVVADYRPHFAVEAREATLALGLMQQAFRCLGERT